jgi:hypothetical protein
VVSGSVVASLASLVSQRAPGAVRVASGLVDAPTDSSGRVLPVRAELAELLPLRGLRRGSTVVVRGSTSVLLALLAAPTMAGSWAAVVGMPEIGLVAAAELGVVVSRLALVPRPGAQLVGVVAALLDGLDLVVVGAGFGIGRASGSGRAESANVARRLAARARHRQSVLISTDAWPGADLELDCTRPAWSGPGRGDGHLRARELTITVRGRGAATRPVHGQVWLPAEPGGQAPEPPPLRPVSSGAEHESGELRAVAG